MKIKFIAGRLKLAAIICIGCNGTTPVAETISDSRPDEKIEKTDLREGPSGELLSGLAAPPPVGEADLLEAARKALSQNRAQDAVAITDVLVLTNPGDMEVLELRGRALIAQGNEEDGRPDLETCCAAGRKSCCP